MSTWTPEQIELIEKYGLCEECGQPMGLFKEYDDEMLQYTLTLECTVDRSHAKEDVRLHWYPTHRDDMRPVRSDPTYGRIDRDIQWRVDDMQPESLAQRVAMENTLQDRRDGKAWPKLT